MADSDQIINEFLALGLPVPQSLAELITRGEQYSYQGFDILSSCMGQLYKYDPAIWERLVMSRVKTCESA